jgi:hypothetical protein
LIRLGEGKRKRETERERERKRDIKEIKVLEINACKAERYIEIGPKKDSDIQKYRHTNTKRDRKERRKVEGYKEIEISGQREN